MEDWREYLKDEYRRQQGCMEVWADIVRDERKENVVAQYLKNIDWAMERNFPTLDKIRQHFADMECMGVYVDKEFDGEILFKQRYVFHNCKGVVKVEMRNATIPMLYFGNNCDMVVVCEQKNVLPLFVPLYIFGENSITTKGNDLANFQFYHTQIITHD